MPVAVRCPSCNAPLPETPDADGVKCSYCGMLVQATRYMPAPVLSPPVMVPPPESPLGAAGGAEPWRSPGAPPVARKSGVARFLIVFFVMDALIGAGVVVFYLMRPGSPPPPEVPSSFSGSPSSPGRPVVLPTVALEPGTTQDVDVPASSGAPVTADLEFTVPAAGPWQAWMSAENVSRSCKMSLHDADGRKVDVPTEDSRHAWVQANLPVGAARLHVECEDSPIPQQLLLRAEPLPRWDGRNPVRVTAAEGAPAAGMVLPIERDGVYAATYDGSGMGPVHLMAADGSDLGSMGTAKGAVSTLRLPAGEVLARFENSGTEAAAGEMTLVWVGPEPLALGETVLRQPTDEAPFAYWSVKLEEPLRLAVTVATEGGGADVRIVNEGGVEVASVRGSGAVSSPTAAAVEPLSAGTYEISVLSNGETPFRIWAHEAGELRVLQAEERAEFQALRGCSCKADVDGEPGDDLVQLAVRITGKGLEMISQTYMFDLLWALDAGSVGAIDLAGDEADAPPTHIDGSRVGVALACTDEAVVVAALDRVTAWSVGTRRKLWSTSLAGVYPTGGGGGGGDLAIQCGRLTVRSGVASVPLSGGGKVNVRLSDGVLQP